MSEHTSVRVVEEVQTNDTPTLGNNHATSAEQVSPAESTRPVPVDFIRDYARYADILEAPRIMHEVVAMQLLATVLNISGVRIQLGGILSPLNLWTVLLSGSGFGRSTLLTLAQPILQAATLEGIVHSALWGSAQAVYQHLAEHPAGLFVWGELSERLKLLNDPRFLGIKPWLTDRYDNLKIPDSVTYRETGHKHRDTPHILFPSAPRINILATSSEEWFFNNLLTEDSAGGFVPRWLLIRAPNTGRVIPIPGEPDPAYVQPLADHLKRASELVGVADLRQIEQRYRDWYRPAKERFSDQQSGLADAYFNRHRLHVLKLALIYEVASSASLHVSEHSWEKAVAFAAELERTIFSLLSTGMSGSGYKSNQMENRVHRAGEEGLSLSDFTRAFQHTDKQLRESLLNTLMLGETIFGFKRVTPGRNGSWLVHREFAETYRTLHPEDSPVRAGFR